MIWYAVVSDKIETVYAGDGDSCDLRRDIVGFEDFQHIPVPDGLNIHTIVWNDSEIVEDTDKIQTNLEEAWTSVRRERNIRLALSDWTRLDDVQCDKEAWAEYRQSLRDLPSTVTNPTNVTWPAPPS
jgi:hypothetical protein